MSIKGVSKLTKILEWYFLGINIVLFITDLNQQATPIYHIKMFILINSKK